MKKSFFILILIGINCYSQKNLNEKVSQVVAEGKTLYKSEMASWYGTDLFIEKYKEQGKIGGYFSYSENELSKCIFFSKDENPKVIGTIIFDATYNIKTAKVELEERTFSKNENDLYTIRTKALNAIKTDTIFKSYQNSSLNLIPIISNNEKKVYVLTGPTNSGVVIFGNDYLLNFDKNNNLISTKTLHANIIPVNYGNEKNITLASIHSHLPQTGDLITATDICTTMLYEKFTKWETVYVMSQKYVSIWNCKTDELVVMNKDAFDKIGKEEK
ncbi:hypothetical protein IRZ71_12275 [Flavobacterium sp. ANB]|uniref:hypothetical protein n=1 Tax=unclassified Flavobacterium TaxID=196869 RepID=UPI0012B73C62|nr:MULTISPECIES: hypothetical protein [unclassified Flavobacterium]MBF4517130.1 hypothetical protein [Flavobacterium sp. ANB]MTD71867.1 hypothetical protein [Flavobacterium sp. LC2016-13]